MKRGSIETSRATSMPACSCGTGRVAATSPFTSTLSCEMFGEQRGRVAVDQMQHRARHDFVAAHGKRHAVLAVGAAQLQRIERAEVGERQRLTAAARHERAGLGGGRRPDAERLHRRARRAPASVPPVAVARSRSDRRVRPDSARGTLPTPVAAGAAGVLWTAPAALEPPPAAATSAADASGAASAVCKASQHARPRISRCEPGRATRRICNPVPLRS